MSDSQPPEPQAEFYDTTRFGELYYGSRAPTIVNLGLAANYLISIFQWGNILFAFLVLLTHGYTSITIFIHTGGQWDNGYPAYTVSADIIISGRRAQGIQGNDYRDLEFLLNTYAMEIYNVRQWLWPRQKNVFFQDYATVNAAFPDRANNVKILLGIPDNAK
ncbi:hypothetical protein NA56DRAFT_684303 [Hyaloscypha hepaticicola]|uniref:Uncharacterized protein n=1 Tax=Hyaloscypha hepaticicola TaxID=2082293 RepID=A0A2J6QNK4_9HELO|nr:hypothetical protein NA56DRAFT_684303 [Hyaloscypha hepaticicola]